MKSNFYKTNPKRILGYLMAFCMVLCTYTIKAQCVPNGNVCVCPMIYNPVCGCDGVLYSNDCLANCQGVAYTPAVPDGSGGFLPCAIPVNCTVEVTATATNATSVTSNDGTATATLVGPTTCATTFLWSNGSTTAAITNLSPGTYTVYTTDCQGCVDSASVTVGAVGACVMTASASATDETWLGACDGTASVTASNSVCVTTDTVLCATTGTNYTALQTRGYMFQAQSSFIISGVMCAESDPNMTNQSIEIVDFGTISPAAFGSTGTPHTVLFSAIDVSYGWLSTGGVSIVAGNYYAIMGSKCNAGGAGSNTQLYAPSQNMNFDGIPTMCTRMVLQSPLSLGSPVSGSYLSNGTGSISSIHVLTGVTAPGALSYLWSNGDTTQSITGLCTGSYSVTVTDCAGCTAIANGMVSTTYMGCTDSIAINYNPLATIDDGSCIYKMGCMDPFASNYDPLATMSNGSCLYHGCMDPFALNYSSSFNADCDTIAGGNSTTCCVYPQGNVLDFCDDFESQAIFTSNGWTTLPGTAAGCAVQLTTANAIADTVSLEMTGADVLAGWIGTPTTETQAFANTSHVSSSTITFDLSTSTGPIDLVFDYKTESNFSSGSIFGGSVYSTMRVKVNGVVVSDVNGDSWHGSETLTNLRYNLSSYAGQVVSVTFESACRYGPGYSSGIYGDYVWIDNVCAFNVTPCTYYSANATSTDVTCNGGSDGSVSATITGMDTIFTYNNSYSWTDASASVVGTSSTVAALAAGTYTCTVSDSNNGCTATTSILVEEPTTPVTVTAVVVPASTPVSNNGSVDITVSGGTPCYTGSPILITEYDASAPDALEIQNVSNLPVDVTGWSVTVSQSYTDINLANTIVQTLSGTMMPGEIKFWTDASTNNYWGNNLFWNNGACTSFKGWIMIKDASGTVVDVFVACWSDLDIAASTVGLAGMWTGNGFDQSTLGPIQSASRVALGNSSAAFVVANTSLGVTNTGLSLPFASAGAYTFAWFNDPTNPTSQTDTTEDVSGLGMGPVAITVTDCNGCIGTWNGFVIAATTAGCLDQTASNYNPSANADCASNPIVAGLYGDTSCCLYPGCIDLTASNYNPSANISDSSCIYPGCTDSLAINYNPQSNLDDGSCQPCSGLIILDNQTFSCYGANDGSVTVSAIACATWNWTDNGSTIANRQNMAPGVYTLVGMTCDSSCIDSLVVTISEQTAITSTMSIGNEYPAGASNGYIDLTVSGGTPCVTAASLSSWNTLHTSNASNGVHFNIVNTHSGPLTITGFSQGSLGSYTGGNNMSVYYMPATYANTTTAGWTQVANGVAITVPTGGSAAAPAYSAPFAITPVTIPAGATYGFYVGGTSTVQYSTASASGPAGTVVASNSHIGITSGHGGTFGSGTFNPRAPVLEVHYGDPSAQAYTYSWSTGDTTEDISGLTSGQYCVTVTDCDGCSSTFCDSVIVSPTYGCTDSTAVNYNSNANSDDGSCCYLGCTDTVAFNYNSIACVDDGSCCFVSGCMDPMATNYNATACWADSCMYPTANLAPFCENWESGSSVTNGWILSQGSDAYISMTDPAYVGLQSYGPISGTNSLDFAGNSSSGWVGGSTTTEAQAFSNTTKVSSAVVIMDFSSLTNTIMMDFDATFAGYFDAYSWLRVKINGVPIADVNGNTSYNRSTGGAGGNGNTDVSYTDITYDLSAYAGMSNVDVIIEGACRLGPTYYPAINNSYADRITVDNICFYEPSPCDTFTASAVVDSDVSSCYGGSDGSATASSTGGAGSYWFNWSNGDTTATATGLSAGTHSCVVTDSAGCVDTAYVTINQPDSIVLSAVVVDPSAAGNDGSIDLSVSGGTACVAGGPAIVPGSHNSITMPPIPNNFTRGFWFKAQSSFIMSGLRAPSDNPAAATAAKQSVAIIDFGATQPSSISTLGSTGNVGINHWAAFNVDTGWADISGGFQVIAGNYYIVVGSAHDDPAVDMYNSHGPGGLGWVTVIIDGNPTVLKRAGINGPISAYNSAIQLDNNCFAFPSLSIGRINMRIAGSNLYNFAWSNGSTTEDLSSLSGGSYSVTATDCNGCASSASWTLSSPVSGCTDITACNYDSTAIVDDGSCDLPNGCGDPSMFNYDSLVTCSDPASCIAVVIGCCDPVALNYNPAANTCDNTTCFYPPSGCTDPTATNYDPLAIIDDGSCTYVSAGCGAITGVYMSDVIHDRAVFNWDNMNDTSCQVDQVRIRYREVGTNSWSNKTMGAPVGSGCNTTNTSKLVLNLTPSTTYEYDFKIWYCNAATVNWHSGGTFTTADQCDNVINVTAIPDNTTKTTFCWDTVSTYSFVRLQYRENVAGSSFSNIGGFGVFSPLTCKSKNGLTPGTQYRVMWRTWCNVSGGPYRSPVWDGPVLWTQPTSIRVEGGTTINNLDVYPNPSRDIFNVTFTSEDVQDLDVRIINVIGEVVYTENLNEFVGEYTKQVDLATYTKGVYFLEITTDNGVINKKLILQ